MLGLFYLSKIKKTFSKLELIKKLFKIKHESIKSNDLTLITIENDVVHCSLYEYHLQLPTVHSTDMLHRVILYTLTSPISLVIIRIIIFTKETTMFENFQLDQTVQSFDFLRLHLLDTL